MMRRAVEDKETIIVERSGKPQVVMLSVGEYEQLKGRKSRNWEALVERAQEVSAKIRARSGDESLPSAVEMIRAMREERDEQLRNALR